MTQITCNKSVPLKTALPPLSRELINHLREKEIKVNYVWEEKEDTEILWGTGVH